MRTPKLCRQRMKGRPDRAYVRLAGRKVHCGRWGSPESKVRYQELLRECECSGGRLVLPNDKITIAELCSSYLKHAEVYYPGRDGKPSQEYYRVRGLVSGLRQMFGSTPVVQFGPRKLVAFRQHLINRGLARTHINQQITAVRRIFRWGIEEELVPISILQALQAVSGLRRGKTEARETEPVRPVPRERVDAVLPFLSRQVSAIVELQWLTGMRSGEVVIMRACDIDMSSQVWVYTPHYHKNDWRGQSRVVCLGPRAQGVIRPFLRLTSYLFSPLDAMRERWAECGTHRRQPLARRRTSRRVRDRFDTASYGRAVSRGCRDAFGDRKELWWHPHQLRHAYGQRVRDELGLEAAMIGLGHTSTHATEIYAKPNMQLAIDMVERIG